MRPTRLDEVGVVFSYIFSQGYWLLPLLVCRLTGCFIYSENHQIGNEISILFDLFRVCFFRGIRQQHILNFKTPSNFLRQIWPCLESK